MELGLGDDWATGNAGQRVRMLETTNRLKKTGERIMQGRRSCWRLLGSGCAVDMLGLSLCGRAGSNRIITCCLGVGGAITRQEVW